MIEKSTHEIDKEIINYIAELLVNKDNEYLAFKIFDTGLFSEIVKAACMAAVEMAGVTPDKKHKVLCELECILGEETAVDILRKAVWLTC